MLKSPSAKELGRHRVQPMAGGASNGMKADEPASQSTTKLTTMRQAEINSKKAVDLQR